MGAAESAARYIVRRRHQRRCDIGITREIGATEVQAVQRRVVLIGRESEHGESGRISILSRYERHTRQRRRHRRDVALLIGGNRAVVDGPLAAADVGCRVVALGSIALGGDSDCLELTRGAQQLGVGLIGGALHLESARRVADRREFDEVVTLTAGTRDRVATALVGARAAIDVSGERCRGDFGVLEGLSFRAQHLAADDVQLLRGERAARNNRSD